MILECQCTNPVWLKCADRLKVKARLTWVSTTCVIVLISKGEGRGSCSMGNHAHPAVSSLSLNRSMNPQSLRTQGILKVMNHKVCELMASENTTSILIRPHSLWPLIRSLQTPPLPPSFLLLFPPLPPGASFPGTRETVRNFIGILVVKPPPSVPTNRDISASLLIGIRIQQLNNLCVSCLLPGLGREVWIGQRGVTPGVSA